MNIKNPPWVALSLIVLILLAYFFLGRLIKGGIENFSVAAIGVPVKVKDVDVSFLNSTAYVEGLSLASFEPNTPPWIKLEQMYLDYNLKSLLFNPTITFHRVTIDGLKIMIGGGDQSQHFSRLKDKWIQYRSSSKVGRNLIIEELEVKNIMLKVNIMGVSLDKNVPDFKLKNLGTKGKPTYFGQVCLSILEELLGSLTKITNGDSRLDSILNLTQ